MIKIVDLQNINFVDHTSQCMKMQPAMLQKQTCIAEFFSLFSRLFAMHLKVHLTTVSSPQ